MMRSLFAGVSGLRNHQVRMDVIGNNIANVNTVGYKSSQVTFQDVLSQTLRSAAAPEGGKGGINPQQVGLGVTVGAISTNQTQGSIQMTGKATDLALEGDGYFVLMEGAQKYYTRAGAFTMDKLGNIVNGSNGMKVAGWQADASGNIVTSGPSQPLAIPLGDTIAPNATTGIALGGNLDINSNGEFSLGGANKITLSDGSVLNLTVRPTDTFNKFELVVRSDDGTIDGSNQLSIELEVDYSGGQWQLTSASPENFNFTNDGGATATIALNTGSSSGDALFSISGGLTGEGTEPEMKYTPATVVQTTEVFDSRGNSHTVTTTFTKRSNTEWAFESTVPGSSDTSGSAVEGAGVITFDTVGRIDDVSVTKRLQFTPAGAEKIGIDMDFDRITMYADDNSVFLVEQDGYEEGILEGFSVDGRGVLTGEFSNGLTKAIGQVAVATFANPAGLLKAGENAFAVSNNSGVPDESTAGVGSRGNITPGALEMSNVDLSQEFTDMIVTQRGFQANSRIITSSDEMLQELVNLKR